jgi:magnesium chelatase family protein
MHVEVPRQPIAIGGSMRKTREEGSDKIQARILAARKLQYQRQGMTNQSLAGNEIETHIQIDKPGEKLLQKAVDQLGLSMRAYHRIIKVARTIADIEASPQIHTQHLSEAIGYRRLDRRQLY